MTHGSLFSGIGGFDLAAQWAGITNVFQCEIDDFCQKVLAKNFPTTEKHRDIYEFKAEKYRGTIDIISGGFPCQPFSQAGARRGTADHRYLWDEMFRIISEIRPSWVIAENVYGLLTISGGMVFEKCLTDLEAIGYEVQPFIIPAIAKDAPHRRDRVWIIANSAGVCNARQRIHDNNTSDGRLSENQSGDGKEIWSEAESGDCGGITNSDGSREQQRYGNDRNERQWTCDCDKEHIANTDNCRRGKLQIPSGEGRSYESDELFDNQFRPHWYEVATALCGVDDGLSRQLDRSKRIKALGNAIVPQVACEIFKIIKQIESRKNEKQ